MEYVWENPILWMLILFCPQIVLKTRVAFLETPNPQFVFWRDESSFWNSASAAIQIGKETNPKNLFADAMVIKTMVIMVTMVMMVTSNMVMAMAMAMSRAYIVYGLYCLWLYHRKLTSSMDGRLFS